MYLQWLAPKSRYLLAVLFRHEFQFRCVLVLLLQDESLDSKSAPRE
jgi:hypothetical protein